MKIRNENTFTNQLTTKVEKSYFTDDCTYDNYDCTYDNYI